MRTNSTYPPQSIQNKNPPRRKTMFSVVPEGCPGVRLGAGPERRDADPVLAHSTGGVRGREGGCYVIARRRCCSASQAGTRGSCRAASIIGHDHVLFIYTQKHNRRPRRQSSQRFYLFSVVPGCCTCSSRRWRKVSEE